jgi:hypothetical protein
MDATSSATKLAKSVSVLDAVIWIAEATKQVSPQTVQRCFQEVKFSTSDLNEKETNENNIQDLQESLNQATYENVTAEDYLNIDAEIETEAAIEETDDIIENHRQGKEEKDDEKDEGSSQEPIVECKLKSHRSALKNIRELQEFSLHQNNSELFDTICRARILIENHASMSFDKIIIIYTHITKCHSF